VDNLDRNVVLGLFTWSDDPAFAHRELDVEFSRWGDPGNQNAQYVVQPFTSPGNIFRFDEPTGLATSTHLFSWSAGSVTFESEGTQGPFAEHVFTAGVPQPGGEVVHVNLWLNRRRGPTDGQPVEVVLRQFEFTPP